MKINKFVITLISSLFLFLRTGERWAQNFIQVPFNTGFVGDNGGNNKPDNSVLLSSFGWERVFFTQNSNSNMFVALSG